MEAHVAGLLWRCAPRLPGCPRAVRGDGGGKFIDNAGGNTNHHCIHFLLSSRHRRQPTLLCCLTPPLAPQLCGKGSTSCLVVAWLLACAHQEADAMKKEGVNALGSLPGRSEKEAPQALMRSAKAFHAPQHHSASCS